MFNFIFWIGESLSRTPFIVIQANLIIFVIGFVYLEFRRVRRGHPLSGTTTLYLLKLFIYLLAFTSALSLMPRAIANGQDGEFFLIAIAIAIPFLILIPFYLSVTDIRRRVVGTVWLILLASIVPSIPTVGLLFPFALVFVIIFTLPPIIIGALFTYLLVPRYVTMPTSSPNSTNANQESHSIRWKLEKNTDEPYG